MTVPPAKEKRKSTWGKYTKGALGAHHYAGWNQDGIIRFNQLCQKVKEDRENNPITEELYKTHCWQQQLHPKNETKDPRVQFLCWWHDWPFLIL